MFGSLKKLFGGEEKEEKIIAAPVTDFIFSCRLPMANQPFMLLVQGVVFPQLSTT